MSPLAATTVTLHCLPLVKGDDPHFAPDAALAAVVVYVTEAVGGVAVSDPLQFPAIVRPVLVMAAA